MQFKQGTPLYSYEVQREGTEDVLYLNFVGAPFVPSLSEQPQVMELTLDALIENPHISRLVFVQHKNYNYDFTETKMLHELASLYVFLVKQENILSHQKLVVSQEHLFPQRYNELLSFVYLLKQDPLAAYSEIKRLIVETKIALENSSGPLQIDYRAYLSHLTFVFEHLEKLTLFEKARPYLPSYKRGERTLYSRLFQPDILPSFTFTRIVLDLPTEAEILDQYTLGESHESSQVTIFRLPNEARLQYYLSPPEARLSEDHTQLLHLARGVLLEHQPKAEEFTDTERTRQVFFNIAKDLIRDLAGSKQISLNYDQLQLLAKILVRHTIGFGLLEVLLQDEHLQDVVLNAPIPQTPVYARHGKFGECTTNILPSHEDVNSWAAKFRMISGRPLDEANPILDTQLQVGETRARVAIIQQPLSPDGLSYALRRHRDSPWTLPLFVQNKMLNPFAAGLLSFLIDGSRTLLVAGTRSSGKTSLLGSLMLEIIPRYRVIVIEDSLELPVEALRKLHYDILRMKVRSALLKTTTEVSADDGIRTSLRLGDSCLILGEVRSVEAKALYEAMRVGALANVVAGTIHGASPYGVFDRVVNDLDVPATSFKATDIIAVANPIKSPDGLHSSRRLLQLAEVRKHWREDPQAEKGFVDLMKYNVEKDELEITEDLKNGDSEIIKDIASNVKGWSGNWDAVYDNILLRSQLKSHLVSVAESRKDQDLLEAPFCARSNDVFHKISEDVREEIGLPLAKEVFPRWQQWLNDEVSKRRV